MENRNKESSDGILLGVILAFLSGFVIGILMQLLRDREDEIICCEDCCCDEFDEDDNEDDDDYEWEDETGAYSF